MIHHEVGLMYLSHRVLKALGHIPKGDFERFYFLNKQIVVIRCNIDTILKSLNSHWTDFHTGFQASSSKKSDFMGFQLQSAGIGFGQSHHG